MSEEIWKDILNYEKYYQASNFGRIKRIMPGRNTYIGKILSLCYDEDGYLLVSLSMYSQRKTHKVHRLVIEAFQQQIIPPGYEVNHKNGIKTDNRYPENLEILTPGENQIHALRSGLKEPSPRKLSLECENIIRQKYLSTNIFEIQLAEEHGVSLSTISRIIHR